MGLIGTKDAAEILQRELTAFRPTGTKMFRVDEEEVRRLASEQFEPTIDLPTETRQRRKKKITNTESVPLGQNHGLGRFKHLYQKGG